MPKLIRRSSASQGTTRQGTEHRHNQPDEVCFEYTNYRGVKATRRVRPIKIWFGSSQYHPHPQWIMRALDTERNVERDFALRDISNWRLPPV